MGNSCTRPRVGGSACVVPVSVHVCPSDKSACTSTLASPRIFGTSCHSSETGSSQEIASAAIATHPAASRRWQDGKLVIAQDIRKQALAEGETSQNSDALHSSISAPLLQRRVSQLASSPDFRPDSADSDDEHENETLDQLPVFPKTSKSISSAGNYGIGSLVNQTTHSISPPVAPSKEAGFSRRLSCQLGPGYNVHVKASTYGVSLLWLMRLADQLKGLTLSEVYKTHIKPIIMKAGCRYSETIPAEHRGRPTCYVAYPMHKGLVTLENLVRCLKRYFRIDTLPATALIEIKVAIDMCWGDWDLPGYTSSFTTNYEASEALMAMCQDVVVVLDAKGKALRRLAILYEIALASEMGKKLSCLTYNIEAEDLLAQIAKVNVEMAEARPEFSDQMRRAIRNACGGDLGHFNDIVREALLASTMRIKAWVEEEVLMHSEIMTKGVNILQTYFRKAFADNSRTGILEWDKAPHTPQYFSMLYSNIKPSDLSITGGRPRTSYLMEPNSNFPKRSLSICHVEDRGQAGNGVSLMWLMDFAAAVPNQYSTEQVKREIIISRTAATKGRFLDVIPQEHQGPPAFFISHSWSMPFQVMVQKLMKHFSVHTMSAVQLQETRVWIDVFSVCQHSTDDQIADLSQLQHILASCKKTLFMLDKEGAILSRMWCLYEVWQTVTQDPAKLVALAYDVTFSDMEAIIDKIDSQKAKASVQKDLDMILDDIRRSIGTDELDRIIKRALLSSASQEGRRSKAALLRCADELESAGMILVVSSRWLGESYAEQGKRLRRHAKVLREEIT